MKRVSWILTIPLALVLVAFAIANRQSVTVDLWPLQLAVGPLPFFAWFLGAVFVGILAGGMAVWLTGGKVRRRARAAERRARELERDLAHQRTQRAAASADSVSVDSGPAGGGQPMGSAPARLPESGDDRDRGVRTRKTTLPVVGP